MFSSVVIVVFFFLMIRRPPRSTQSRSSAASDVYKRQVPGLPLAQHSQHGVRDPADFERGQASRKRGTGRSLSLIHISEPTRLLSISYAVFCLKKKNTT